MAEKRMFAKTIIDSDAFLEMPMSARLLYYDLAMRADDDGFINSPKKIMKIVGATTDDLNILILRKFIIPFENGVVVIKHWRIHNYIRKDTYTPTPYLEQKSMLAMDENKAYTLVNQDRGRLVDGSLTQIRVEENREVKDREDKISEGESNTHAHEEVDFETIWQQTFNSYPKKSNYNSAKTEWMNIICSVVEPNRKDMATMIWNAIQMYLKDYKKKNTDDDNYRFVPAFNKWLTEELDYWMEEARRKED